ncbi:putative bacitracin ABC transporter, ATP-binding protein BcrA [Enterococcus faecalis 13-SD-W-01]|nr:putative bacitracin ABC transporter, ATP-binding protein BcrA [Enterococcus faecalis 13-SD-W-01]
MKTIVQVNSLTKTYRKTNALENISLNISKGDIYGFVGKNGAGKTTLIRLLAGLIKPTSGEIRYRENNLKIGAVIESPACYPYLTAEENLMYYAIQQSIIFPRERVNEVLKFVGLSQAGKKVFKDFSLGMRQRLGLGLAILNNPDFLILDEPVNGLDPEGIVEIRNIIKELNEVHGTTILISSHLLSELSMLATRYAFIHQGKLIKEITKQDLEHECKSEISLLTSDNDKALDLLTQAGYYLNTENKQLLIYNAAKTDMKKVGRILFDNGIYLQELAYKEEKLEDYFLNLLGED